MSEEQPRQTGSPWRWVLLVVAIVAAGYSVYYAGGVTTSLNDTPVRTPRRADTQTGPSCPLPPSVQLPERVDVRFRVDTEGPTIVSNRLTGTVDGDQLHIAGLRGNGVGTVQLADGRFAEFTYRNDECSAVSVLPPPSHGVNEATP